MEALFFPAYSTPSNSRIKALSLNPMLSHNSNNPNGGQRQSNIFQNPVKIQTPNFFLQYFDFALVINLLAQPLRFDVLELSGLVMELNDYAGLVRNLVLEIRH